MNYNVEIVRDFNGLYYCNLFINGEQVKDMPEYVQYDVLLEAIYDNIGVKLTDIEFTEHIGRKSYAYANGCVEDTERTIHNDKKTNMEYWDNIENTVEDAIIKIAKEYSDVEISQFKLEENITDIVKEATEVIIKRLKEIGGEFLYVDENY